MTTLINPTAQTATALPVQPVPQGNALQLILATGAFVCCFAVFGSVSAMMPALRQRLGLTPLQVSVALALAVLLGGLGIFYLVVFRALGQASLLPVRDPLLVESLHQSGPES